MTVSQQVFLRDAMRRLNLTRDVFAGRIGVKRRALDTWLLPEGSQEFRAMPEVVNRFVTEIVENETLLQKYAQSAQSGPLRNRIAYEGKSQLLSVDQFSRESVEDLFRIADQMQPIARRQKVSRVLEGAVLGNLFFEASTRTRVSFGAAFCRLGGSVCDTTGFTFSSMAKGESIYDTSRVMSGYVDAMVIRHPEKGSVAEFARATNIPVVNGGDGPGEHPSQALLDLYTILTEFSRLGKLLDGAHIALVGDLKYGRTVHSLIKLLALYRGLKFTLIAPKGLEMPEYLLDQVGTRGHVIEQTSSLEQGLPGADVIYATRVQKERFSTEELEGYSPDFQVNKAIIDKCCGPDVIVMHPLPRDSREGANDLSVDLNHDPRSSARQTMASRCVWQFLPCCLGWKGWSSIRCAM
jgi:aspartate carbamoyltransferase catalytic subunit